MSKWNRYRQIEIVDVFFFAPPLDPANPPYPVELERCYCDGMNGRVCGRHLRVPRYEYTVHGIDRWVSIRPGEYLVKFNNGQYMTVSPEELGERYEPLAEDSRRA